MSEIVKVSIVSLAYNHAPYVEKTIQGFLMQDTPFPVEIIIHDDASPDGTADIIRKYADKYPGRFTTVLRETNQYSTADDFSASVIRSLIANAKGEYIAFCECDDYWTDPHKLRKQAEYLDNHPDVGLVYTRSQAYFNTQGKFGDVFGGYSNHSFKELLTENRIPTQTIMYRRDLWLRYSDEIFPLRSGHQWKMGDYPYFLWLAVNSKIAFIPDCTAVYRILDKSAANFTDPLQKLDFRINAFEISRFFADRYDPSLLHIPEAQINFLKLEKALISQKGVKEAFARIDDSGATPVTPHQAKMLRFRRFPRLYPLAKKARRLLNKLRK